MQSRRPDAPNNEGGETTERRSQTSLTKPPAAPAASREAIRESMRADQARDSVRRDPRAEDDDPPAHARVDVVSVDRSGSSGGDAASSALGTIRRELARLQQQAATVERTLEDHRRDRTEATERYNHEKARASDLEGKLQSLLDQVHNLQEERDSLALAVEEAKKSVADAAKLNEQLEDAKKAHAALDAQLVEVRKRQYQETLKVTEKDTEIAGLKSKLEKSDAEAVKAKKEVSEAKEAATKTKAEAEKAKKEEKAKVDKVLAELRGEIENLKIALDMEKSDRQSEAAQVKIERDAETARARKEHETAIEDAKKRASELEASLAEARASIGVAESRAIAAESKAMSSAAAAGRQEARAIEAEQARALIEENVGDLRREISSAFTRFEAAKPLPAKPSSVAPVVSSSVVSTLPEVVTGSTKVSAKPNGISTGTAAPPAGAAVPPPASKPAELETNASALVIEVPEADSEVPPSRMQTAPPPAVTGPVADLMKRAPSEPPEISSKEEVISVPPDLAASLPPEELLDEELSGDAELKIAPLAATPHLSALANAIDAAWGNQSSPPPSNSAKSVPPPPGASAPPNVPKIRDELFAKLVDPDRGREAAEELRQHPEWLQGTPPPSFLAALIGIDYDSEAPVFELARAWDRESICHALVSDLRAEEDARLREHTAWLLKHLAVPSACKALTEIVKNDDEPVQLRRWLLEALDRLAAGRSVSWPELGEVVTALAHHPDSTIRDGVVGILTSLERSDEKGKMLLEILKKDDDEGVLSSAVEALASVLPIELDPSIAERLLGHKSTRVQRSVRELIDRARRESRRPAPI